MPLTSKISEYDPHWIEQYKTEETRLVSTFGRSLIEIHHIGSTAVQGLSAKPEIDILVVVAPCAINVDWSAALSALGYKRGGNLSLGHQFYKRDKSGIRTHKLHVCVKGHAQIKSMLEFRDELRSNDQLRLEYGALKRELERTNRSGIGEYLEKKTPFIESVLQAIRSKNDHRDTSSQPNTDVSAD